MTDHRTYHVVPFGRSWAVEEEGGGSPSSAQYASKAEALEQAGALVREHPTATIVVHRRDGTIEGESRPGLPLIVVR